MLFFFLSLLSILLQLLTCFLILFNGEINPFITVSPPSGTSSSIDNISPNITSSITSVTPGATELRTVP
jgi:hypothetical protein